MVKGLGSVDDLLRRCKAAEAEWALFRTLYQEAFDYANPNRQTFTAYSPGQKKNRQVFDSTAVIGLEQFASRIQASMLPSWLQWMNLVAGDMVPEGDEDRANELLEEATDTFFTHLNHSNFDTEIAPSLSDLGIGTGAIQIEEGVFGSGQNVLKFTNIPLPELYIENRHNVWRKYEIEARDIKQTWPAANIPQGLENIIKDKPYEKVKIISAMLHNPADQKYHQIVIHDQSKKIIFSQAFSTMRLIVFRWHLVPGENYGRGPIIQMLPDIRTVNKVKQFILENAALQLAGVYTGVDDGIFNPHTVRIAPGAVIPVKSNASTNPTLAPLNRAGDIGLGDLILSDLQDGIKKALYVDPIGDIQDPVRTATEIMIRQQEMLKHAGASIGRLKTELIEPLVAAVVDILSSLGHIAPIRVDGQEVTIKHVSPLAKAEDLEDFQNSQIWYQNIASLPPEIVMASVKLEELPRFWQRKLSVPAELVRTDEEREIAGQQIQAMANQMMAQPGQGGQPGMPPQGGMA